MRRVLKLVVVAVGSLPALVISLLLLSKLDISFLAPAGEALRYIAGVQEEVRLLLNGHVAFRLAWPAVPIDRVTVLVQYVLLPAGIVGVLVLSFPRLSRYFGGRSFGRPRRLQGRHGTTFRERVKDWRNRRLERREAERRREEEMERNRELERKRREGLTLEDLVH